MPWVAALTTYFGYAILMIFGAYKTIPARHVRLSVQVFFDLRTSEYSLLVGKDCILFCLQLRAYYRSRPRACAGYLRDSFSNLLSFSNILATQDKAEEVGVTLLVLAQECPVA